jgi:hypothetical protein
MEVIYMSNNMDRAWQAMIEVGLEVQNAVMKYLMRRASEAVKIPEECYDEQITKKAHDVTDN